MRNAHWGARYAPALAVAFSLSSLSATMMAAGQQAAKPAAPAAKAAANKAAAPKKPTLRTPDGKPDLQGVWDFAQLTPFERPDQFGNQSQVDPDAVEEFAQQKAADSNKDRRDGPATVDVERAYNDFWWDFGHRVAKQTSLVVDPAGSGLSEHAVHHFHGLVLEAYREFEDQAALTGAEV